MLKQEKCHNCGASLTYDERNYNGEVTCQYCRTKYHLDNLGKIEEYKVKLMIFGVVREFYIESVTFDESGCYCECERDIDGELMARIARVKPKMILGMRSFFN